MPPASLHRPRSARGAAALSTLVVAFVLALGLGIRLVDPAPVETLRLAAFDQMHRMAPRPAESVPVRIVDIDEESLARIGQWPWPRTVLADLTRRLDQAGAAAIAFDVLFAEPDRWSAAGAAGADPAVARALAQIPDPDRAFADALVGTRAVLGVAAVAAATGERPGEKAGMAVVGDPAALAVRRFPAIVRSIPVLADAARGEGAINAVPDRDGVIRRLPLLVAVGDRLVPSLAAEAIRLAQGAAGYVVREDGAGGLLVRIGNLIVPADARGEVWPHLAADPEAPRVPAWRVLDGSAAAAIGRSIVLVGSSAAGLKDLRTTALATAVAGVDIQAEAVANLLLGTALRRPGWTTAAEAAFAAAVALLLLLLAVRAGIAAAAVAAAAALAGIGVVVWSTFGGERLLLDPTFPAAVTVAAIAGLAAVAYRRAEAERRRIRTAFQHYLSPALVERLAAAPERLALGGETRRLTVLFGDIRHFTMRAEALDPQALTGFVNAVMTPLAEELLAEGGTVDKFLGDGVMAFWNAPIAAADHAARACRAALAMVARLDAVNAALAGTMPAAMLPVEVGIGIDTGDCCVGNFGSESRFDYSALGEAVNRAARFEGLSRTYRVPIVIGEATRDAAADLAAIELDEVVVRGGTRPVKVFALVGDAATAAGEGFAALSRSYAALRAALARGDAPAALAALSACRASDTGMLAGLLDRHGEAVAALLADGAPGPARLSSAPTP